MSFYHKLAQHFLTQHFTEVNNEAERKNNAYFGAGKLYRDTELSHEKQESGQNATMQLHDWTWDRVSDRYEDEDDKHWGSVDEFAKDRFESIIDEYGENVQDKIKKAGGGNSGETVNAVYTAKELLELIKKQCEDYHLWNEEYDDSDPGDIFIYNMLLYICSRIKNREQLTIDKIKITKEMLRKTTSYFLKNDAMSQKEKIGYVKDEIKALINANKVVCNESSKKTTIPASLPGHMASSVVSSLLRVSVSTSIGSSEGALGKVLDQTLARITKLSDSASGRKKRTSRVLKSISQSEEESDKYGANRHGRITLAGWVESYQNATTDDEKEDIFIGAINLANNDDLFKSAPHKLKNDQDLVYDAAVVNVKTLKYASNRIKSNRVFMMDLIKEVPAAYEYAAERLKRDPDFKKAAMSPFVSMMFQYQHFWGAALIGLAVAAVALAITLTSSLIMPATIAIVSSSALIASTVSFFSLRPAESKAAVNFIESDDLTFEL